MKHLIGLTFLICSLYSNAQQDPLLASEGQRAFWFNPASTGTLNQYSVNSVARRQWAGVEGSPAIAQLNGALKCIEFGNNPTNPSGIGSVGLNYMYDQIGQVNTNSLDLHLNLQFRIKKTFLSIGLAPGIRRMHVDWDHFVFPTPDPDPVIKNINETEFAFSLGGGIYWFNERFSLGVSATHLTAERFTDINYQAARHYYVSGSYKQPLTKGISLRAVVVYRTDLVTNLIGGMLYCDLMNEKLSFGLGTRYQSGSTVSISTRLGKFYAGYFMEYQTVFSGNAYFSHEIRLAYELFDSKTFPAKK